MVRLRTQIWMQAYILRLNQQAINAYIRQHGDDHAGAMVVKLSTLDGEAKVFARQYDFETDQTTWTKTHQDEEAVIEAHLTREMARDRDLWVIEVEDAKGRHLLDQEGF